MIASIMLYGTLVALLVGFAGLAAEYIAAQCSWPRRGIWLAALVLSLGLPTAMVLRSLPAAMTPIAVSPLQPKDLAIEPKRLKEPPALFQVAHLAPAPPQRIIWPALPALDKTLQWIWTITSGGLLVFYGLSWGHLRTAQRDWRRGAVDGQEVWITSNLGPAVFGYFRPRVLLPAWTLDIPAPCRALILSHEDEHIAARDPWLLLLSLVMMAAAPWNLPLWWQWRRLRISIELDCDARVLSRGADLRAYGEILLTLGQRGKITPMRGLIALTEAISHLEHRIRIMTELRPKRRWALLGSFFCLSSALIATAGTLTSPSLTSYAVLRKLPPDDSNIYLEWAEAAARARFPELFQGKFDGSVEVMVGLDRNGIVLGVEKRQYPSGPIPLARIGDDWNVRSALRYSGRVSRGWARAHELEGHDIVPGLPKLLAWFGPHNTNRLYLSFDVIYAWPRLADDPSDEFYRTFVDEVYGPEAPDAPDAPDAREEALNRAILARYFPDVWHNGMQQYPYPKFLWVLLDRHGDIWGTGRFLHANPKLMALEIEELYPGITTGEVVGAKIDTEIGDAAWVRFYWLAPDSAVIEH